VTAKLSRRTFLTSAGACLGGLALHDSSYAALANFLQSGAPQAAPIILQALTRTLEVNGKAATVMGLLQPNGTQGVESMVDTPFLVELENKLTVPTAIHWHGLHPPNNEDGVPGVTQPVIRTDSSSLYNFPLVPSGTHWMHSHQKLQEAYLLAAPLIVHDKETRARDEQQVILFLSDFSFTSPREIFARLRAGAGKSSMGMKSASPMKMSATKPDINDVNYDAYLANDRTLSDPEAVKVEKSGRVRLRIINGSSGTNFFIDLGKLNGELIATDGMPVKPVRASRFPLAIAQRIDVRLQLPTGGGAFPIMALREGAAEQTGIVLASPGAKIARIPVKASAPAGVLTLAQEKTFVAVQPLSPRPIDKTYALRLGGDMANYRWMINDMVFDVENPGSEKAQVLVKPGQRIALKFVNDTPMTHPMHLHGHSFQVIEIDGQPLSGALRDTILVPGSSSVTVAFDANNPGLWYLHCHVLWHLAAGMATLVQYEA